MKLGKDYPVGKILKALRSYCCTNMDMNIWKFIYHDEIITACEKAFDIEMNNKYRTRQQIRRMIGY